MLVVVEKDPPPTGADILPFIAKALEEGRDPINDSTRDGGILVTDDIVSIAADMEVVAETTFKRNYGKFNVALLIEIERAQKNGDDPIEEVALWLRSCLDEDTALSA